MSTRKFENLTGIAAPLLRENIDTDAIIPSREMNRVSKTGLGDGLFAGWRYLNRGENNETENPDFILNQPQYAGATILLTGKNMGCGSSREFAVWALTDYGIRAIIAPSFGAIFHTNCIRNGLLPIVLNESIISVLARQVEVDPQHRTIDIDLGAKVVVGSGGQKHSFDIEDMHRHMLLEGLDSIDITMKSFNEIEAYEIFSREKRPWVHLTRSKSAGH